MTATQLVELRKLKQSSNPYHTAINGAMGLTLRMGELRSVYWKILLGLLPVPTKKDEEFVEDWEEMSIDSRKEIMTKKRAANNGGKQNDGSKKKKANRFGDSDSDESEEEASTADDPLSTAQDSKYAMEFKQRKVIDNIDKDISRLWCDDPFFDDEDIKDQIRNVLLYHCLHGPGKELGYRQGMHEVLSLVFFTLYRDADDVLTASVKVGTSEEEKEDIALLRTVCSRTFVEQDAHLMFEKIMANGPGCLNLQEWYGAMASPAGSPPQSPSMDLGQSALTRVEEHDEQNAVVNAAHIVQNAKLKKVNEPLFRHLTTKLSIPPQAYLLRWLRLLFLREFSFSQCALIWDVIFAELRYAATGDNNKLRVVDGEEEDEALYQLDNSFMVDVSVQMLQYIATELLEADYSFALRRLMRFPPVEDVSPIIRRALEARHAPGSKMLLAAGILPTPQPSPPATAHADPVAAAPSSPTATPASNGASPQPQKKTIVGTESADELRDKQLRMGLLLANVVTRMEDKWFPGERTPEDDAKAEENYVMAIAELKKVRDVLLNNVVE